MRCMLVRITPHSVFLANASSARRFSLRSRPRVTIGFGSRFANSALHTFSMIQHPAKSITIDAVRRTLNCKHPRGQHQLPYKTRTGRLTESCISTICSQRLSSGMRSVAPENATALAPTRP